MPPSNSPADTPVQSSSLPPLAYYQPTVTDSESADHLRNTAPRIRNSSSSNLLPHISTAINQQLVPLLPLPVLSSAIYNQLPSPHGLAQDSDLRSRRNGPRRVVGRDADPRLAIRDQAYGPGIPSITPGQPENLYDWAPAPSGQMYFAGTIGPSTSARTEGEGVPRPHFGRTQYTSPPLAPSVRNRPRDLRHYEHLVPAIASQDNLSNRPFPGSRRYVRSQPHRSRNIGAGYAAEAERDRERLRQRDRDRGHHVDNAEVAADELWPPFLQRRYISRRNRRDSIPPTPREELEETLKYLAKLRGCITMGESLRLALTFGFTRDASWLSQDGCECTYDDFLLDTRMLKVPPTSWLDIGGTFWGSQTTLSTNSTSERYSPSRWTVKVNISGVDYETLRLNGTMEAYADWAKHADQSLTSPRSSGSSSSSASSPASVQYYEYKNSQDSSSSTAGKDLLTPIVTYLEGEIIDFQTHTLETTSFSSTIRDDALYWRKLEPFVNLDPDVLVQSLTSKRFMKQLMQDYVLMRWKEKCFIKGEKVSTNDQAGGAIGGAGLLTIGGFYFVSMKRSDGQIRGYYYDPLSTPYQELVLKPKKRVFPTYEFR